MADQSDEDAIRARACRLREEGGSAHGQREDHRRRAEAECRADGAPRGDGVGAPSGIDGDISWPLREPERKPRRWPPPIIEA